MCMRMCIATIGSRHLSPSPQVHPHTYSHTTISPCPSSTIPLYNLTKPQTLHRQKTIRRGEFDSRRNRKRKRDPGPEFDSRSQRISARDKYALPLPGTGQKYTKKQRREALQTLKERVIARRGEGARSQCREVSRPVLKMFFLRFLVRGGGWWRWDGFFLKVGAWMRKRCVCTTEYV